MKDINFRTYKNRTRFNDDFYKIFEFLKEVGGTGINENWHWGRWEWLVSHPNLDENTLTMIGIWEKDNEIVGIATHDMRLGEVFFLCKPQYDFLKEKMLSYAEKILCFDNSLKVCVCDKDIMFIEMMKNKGYVKSDYKESVLSLDCFHNQPHPIYYS